MSFRILNVTVDGSLANPYVATSIVCLCLLSFVTAYGIVRGVRSQRWRLVIGLAVALAPFLLTPDWLLHSFTSLVYKAHNLDAFMSVSLLGDHPTWLLRWLAPLGGFFSSSRPLLGFSRRKKTTA